MLVVNGVYHAMSDIIQLFRLVLDQPSLRFWGPTDEGWLPGLAAKHLQPPYGNQTFGVASALVRWVGLPKIGVIFIYISVYCQFEENWFVATDPEVQQLE